MFGTPPRMHIYRCIKAEINEPRKILVLVWRSWHKIVPNNTNHISIVLFVQGSHSTWKTWNFVISFPGLEFAQKVVKTWNFNSKHGEKNLKFVNSMSFTKIFLIYFFVISTLSTQTLIWSQIDLGFHWFYLEITWKIHGILCHKRSGNPASVNSTFRDFYY